jgi:dolichol-phosphate mannosyltransferase
MPSAAPRPAPVWLQRLLAVRFIRFGLVGGGGTVVNSAVLWLAQEHLLAGIQPPSWRLNFSQALAIFVATVHNFAWNRVFTWGDRNAHDERHVVWLFAQYTASAGGAIAIQFLTTKVLAGHMHYLLANLVAIAASSVFNFLANDWWTFRQRQVAAANPSAERQRRGPTREDGSG